MSSTVFYLGILWYPLYSKIISSFWGIVFYIRNIILLGLTTKKNITHMKLVDFGEHSGSGLRAQDSNIS